MGGSSLAREIWGGVKGRLQLGKKGVQGPGKGRRGRGRADGSERLCVGSGKEADWRLSRVGGV
eukprot:1308788-Pleurochrysis_carterae.AAC.1